MTNSGRWGSVTVAIALCVACEGCDDEPESSDGNSNRGGGGTAGARDAGGSGKDSGAGGQTGDGGNAGEAGAPVPPTGGRGGSAGKVGTSGEGGEAVLDCESSEILGAVVQPEPPILAPPDGCVSEEYEERICQPLPPTPAPDGACPGAEADGICEPAYEDWNCPPGWETISVARDPEGMERPIETMGAFAACEPIWAEACPESTMPRLGSRECTKISIDCPTTGLWQGEDVIHTQAPGFEGPIVYVDPRAAASGDGSRERPFSTLDAALVGRGAGDIIALARAEYSVGATFVQGRVALIGACASETILRAGSRSDTEALLSLFDSGARVADLTIFGPRPGIGTSGTTGITIERVSIHDALGSGIFAFGAGTVLSITDVQVMRTAISTLGNGAGVSISGRASAALSRVALLQNGLTGLLAYDVGTRVVADDLIVQGTLSSIQASSIGAGVEVGAGAEGTINRAVLAGNRDLGVFAWGVGTVVGIHDALVAGTRQTRQDYVLAYGLEALDRAHVILERTTFSDNLHAGIFAVNPGTTLELEDVRVIDTMASAIFPRGSGIQAQSGVDLVASRVLLQRNEGVGAWFAGPNTTLDLSDVGVLDTTGYPGYLASGVLVDGATGTMERADLRGNDDVGLLVTGGAALLDTSDLRVSDTRLREGSDGAGVWATDEGGNVELSVARGVISSNDFAGVVNFGANTSVQLTDVSVVGNRGVGGVLAAGDNDSATRTLDLTRVLVDGNQNTGIFATGSATTVALHDVSIVNTESADGHTAGPALGISKGTSLTGARVALRSNEEAGIVVSDEPTSLELTDVFVADTTALEELGSGIGLTAFGGSAILERAAFARNISRAIEVECSQFSFPTNRCATGTVGDGQVTLRHAVIRDTQSSPKDGSVGVGVSVFGGSFTLEHGLVTANHRAGVFGLGQASVTLRDVAIEGTLPAGDDGLAHGLVARIGSTVEGERVLVTKNQGSGVIAVEESSVTLTDLTLTHNESHPSRQQYGRGFEANTGAKVTIERTLSCDNRDYGFIAFDDATEVTLRQARVRHTGRAACAGSTCGDAPGGGGIALVIGAFGDLSDFDIRTNSVVGLTIFDALARGRNGVITLNPIGLHVEDSQFDLDRDFDNVEVVGNQVNLDFDTLPVPQGTTPDDLIDPPPPPRR